MTPSTLSERSTAPLPEEFRKSLDAAAVAAAASDYDPEDAFPYAASAAAELQHRHELQRRQLHLHQQLLHQQLQMNQMGQLGQMGQLTQQQQQQQHQQQQQQMNQVSPQGSSQHHIPQQMSLQMSQQMSQQMSLQMSPQIAHPEDPLTSRFIENEIIKSFSNKADLVKYVKYILAAEERCKIVINSSKPKAVYFQCERSGSFRTTVKDAAKRQRIAYTKRSKCGYRLVANLYPSEKENKKIKLEEAALQQTHPGLDDKTAFDLANSDEVWVLRMISPMHNHPPEPMGKQRNKKSKSQRTLVEKPWRRDAQAAILVAAAAQQYVTPDIMQAEHDDYHMMRHRMAQSTASVQDAAVIAAIEATPSSRIDPDMDPNVDPSVLQHDHSRHMDIRGLRH